MPTVSLKQANNESKSFELKNNEVLFEGLERHGFELPHGCLSGSCSACKVEVLEGAENLDQPGEVEADTLASVYKTYKFDESKKLRLSCRAKVIGDIVIKEFEI